jgi:hypothetical protein
VAAKVQVLKIDHLLHDVLSPPYSRQTAIARQLS